MRTAISPRGQKNTIFNVFISTCAVFVHDVFCEFKPRKANYRIGIIIVTLASYYIATFIFEFTLDTNPDWLK